MVLLRARKTTARSGRSASVSATRSSAIGRARCASAPSSDRRLGLLAMAAGLYIYLDVDKRASERALGMLQFCHLALRTAEEQGVLAEQRKNLNGDPVDRGRHPRARRQAAARREAEGARDRGADERGADEAGEDRRRLPHALGRAAEGAGAAQRSRREGAVVAVDRRRRAEVAARGAQGHRRRGQARRRESRRRRRQFKALQAQLGDLDAKCKKLLARPACEPPKPSPPAPRSRRRRRRRRRSAGGDASPTTSAPSQPSRASPSAGRCSLRCVSGQRRQRRLGPVERARRSSVSGPSCAAGSCDASDGRLNTFSMNFGIDACCDDARVDERRAWRTARR